MSATSGSSGPDVPSTILRYFDAHDRRDAETALATFAPDATVKDDGQDYAGSDRIRDWLEHASTQFTYTRTLIESTAIDANTWEVVNNLRGNFPGGVVDLRYRFVLRNDLISELVIAP
jgi:ketosteroid isomerase-like protein